jgi:superfamily II DNA/RNA helicase
MVLIANEVMQEGLDLHRSCRRIIHHDLAWNPAQLEQRVGRIDRLGSRTLQLRARDPEAQMDVVYPLIHRTIDDRLYRTVKTREKWLEFLLGAAPAYDEYAFGDEVPPPLPEGLAEALRVNLKPEAIS